MLKLILLFLLTKQTLTYQPITFLSIGDWGSANLGGYKEHNEINTAKAMYKDELTHNHQFVLNVGDNFYECGIQNLEDSNIEINYNNVFSNTNLTWYNSLGNHDYGYNVTAQILLSNIIKQWVLPSRYYYVQPYPGLYIIVLDTNPCIKAYRSSNPNEWEPCGNGYTCTNYSYEEPCRFHDNIISQNCNEQFDWFNKTLESIPSNSTIIVVGHHPVFEIDYDSRFGYIINSNKISMYINGHSHMFGTYTYANKSKYITNGAASRVKDKSVVKKYPDKDYHHKKDKNKYDMYDWYKKETGYMRHLIFKTHIRNEFVNINNEIIYTYNISITNFNLN
jgi:hypothetical protein